MQVIEGFVNLIFCCLSSMFIIYIFMGYASISTTILMTIAFIVCIYILAIILHFLEKRTNKNEREGK